MVPPKEKFAIGSCNLTKTKSPSLRFINEVYTVEGLMFFDPQ
jgi:hypothetical protein